MTPAILRRLTPALSATLAVCAMVVVERTAAQTPQAKPIASPLAFSLPGRRWALELKAEGFIMQLDQPRDQGRYFLARNDKAQINLSVYLGKMPSSASSTQCRDSFWGRLREREVKMENVKLSERGDTAILEYSTTPFGQALPKAKGPELFGFTQRHVHAYLAREGVCIDVHASKVRAKAEDEPLLDAIIASARIVESSR